MEQGNIIFSFILESGFDELNKYLSKFKNIDDENNVRISAFDEVEKIVSGMEHMFERKDLCNLDHLDDILHDEERVKQYYDFYLKELPTIKREFYDALSSYTCHREYWDKFSRSKFVKSHLYTFLMQEIGNNIRCSGKPYSDAYSEDHFYDVAKRMDAVIRIIQKRNEDLKSPQTRICIDAIRNPYEAYYFKDKYSSFYLLSINTDESERRNRLGKLDEEELQSLDETEYESAMRTDYGIFSHQNMQECLAISDIHLYNPNVNDGRFLFLTEQIVKYIALMLHPGLTTPTHIERCMQTAYVARLNSGCLSRQVGAVITGADFSIKAVGWNEVPEGQIPCNLRCTADYCKNKDRETYSCFELEDKKFQDALFAINEKVAQCELGGMSYSYCFKDIYNELKGSKNQIFTRALHAEENAFLQLSKNGGQGIKGGKLFSTASPCELCAKKAYQLGIKEIYYVDPYPGISTQHILSFGKYDNPVVQLFYGAIGDAYTKLYAPRIPIKDELKLRSGVDCKQVIKNLGEGLVSSLGPKDIKYIYRNNHFIFHSRTEVKELTKTKIEAVREGITQVPHSAYWTGSSFDGFTIKNCSRDYTHENIQGQRLPYISILSFKEPLKVGETADWEMETTAKDTRCIMSPYYAQIVRIKIDQLTIAVSAPKGLLENVMRVVYADTKMSKDLEIFREPIIPELDEDVETFTFDISSPNLMYSYSIEWKFNKQI